MTQHTVQEEKKCKPRDHSLAQICTYLLTGRELDNSVSITRGQSDIVVDCEFNETSASARFGFEDGRFCFGVITQSDPAMSLRACTSVPTEFTMV